MLSTNSKTHALFPGFARFQPVIFVRVANALSLVCVGFTQAIEFRRDLPEFLLVDAAQCDRRLILIDRRLCVDTLGLCLDTIGQCVFDRMRIPERENDLLALNIGFVTDADDVEVL